MARKLLEESEASLVVVKGGEEVLRENGSGVLPLLKVVASQDPAALAGASLADRVIGRAAAFLAVKAGFSAVYSPIMSKPGMELLLDNGIEVHSKNLVANIMRQEPYGLCLMEQMVSDVSEPEEAFEKLVSFFQSKGISLTRGEAV